MRRDLSKIQESTLQALARDIRLEVLDEVFRAGKGHLGASMSWVEIGVILYFAGVLNLDASRLSHPDRDRFILSKGHGSQTLYSILRRLGALPRVSSREPLDGAMNLPGHPDVDIPGVETNTGSLGHGLGIGVGMALSARIQGASYRTYVLLGDGELGEGSVWEAFMLAGHLRTLNLVAIIDRNRFGATTATEDMLALEPLAAKIEAFGWRVSEVDGHNLRELYKAVRLKAGSQPHAIVARTTKGNGIGFMSDTAEWHHKVPSPTEYELARSELASGAPHEN